jgi:hypothetical protein
MTMLLAAIAAVLLLPGPSDAQEAPRRVAVFDVELWDTAARASSRSRPRALPCSALC